MPSASRATYFFGLSSLSLGRVFACRRRLFFERLLSSPPQAALVWQLTSGLLDDRSAAMKESAILENSRARAHNVSLGRRWQLTPTCL